MTHDLECQSQQVWRELWLKVPGRCHLSLEGSVWEAFPNPPVGILCVCVFGCAGCSLLDTGFLLFQWVGATLHLPCVASLVGEHRLQAHGLSCLLACGIFWEQGLELCPLHWQVYSSPLRHQGGPPAGISVCLFTCDSLEGKVPFWRLHHQERPLFLFPKYLLNSCGWKPPDAVYSKSRWLILVKEAQNFSFI